MIFFIVILILIFLAIFLWIFIRKESAGFVTEHYDFYSDKLSRDFHFLFFSDLHENIYGENDQELYEAVLKADPDYILIGGDVITSNKMPDESFDVTLSFLKRLAGRFPVIFVPGNHERALFDIRDCESNPKSSAKDLFDIDRISRLEQCLLENNVAVLRNGFLFLKDYNVTVYGLDLPLDYYRRVIRFAPKREYLCELLKEPDDTSCTVLLAHDPEHFKEYSEWGCDLVLSGHLHGGIIRIPGLGGVISPQLRIFPKYDSGVFKRNKTDMLLTRGIGTHSIPIRIFNKAEICDVVIHKRQNGDLNEH